MDHLTIDQEDEEEMSFTEFCDEFCPEGEAESEPFVILSSNDVVKLMKTETEKVCEIVNVSGFILEYSRVILSSLFCSYLQRSYECF